MLNMCDGQCPSHNHACIYQTCMHQSMHAFVNPWTHVHARCHCSVHIADSLSPPDPASVLLIENMHTASKHRSWTIMQSSVLCISSATFHTMKVSPQKMTFWRWIASCAELASSHMSLSWALCRTPACCMCLSPECNAAAVHRCAAAS